MKKVTLMFPTHDSLWLFKDKSKAINVRIDPKKNLMAGLFDPNEIDLALKEFKAIDSSNNSDSLSQLNHADSKIMIPWFSIRSILSFMKF